MIEIFLKKEAEHKAAAEQAAANRDWASLQVEARRLVSVYGAILVSGLVDRSSHGRWESLRVKWQEIAEGAGRKIDQKSAIDSAHRISPLAEPVGESQTEGGGPADCTSVRGRPSSAPPTLRLSDVQGLEEAKRVVMKALINPVRHPEVYKKLHIRSGKGLLLYGPPGTGKTMFARAIAAELKLPFIYRKASELKDKYVGESEKNVSRLCEEAFQHKRCVVFLDECDDLFRKRGNQKVNILGTFLEEMDGFATRRDSQVFFLLATNRPWLIDSAMMSRIGAAAQVGLPDERTRRDILAAALKDAPLAEDVDLDDLARRTVGYSGRQIAGEGIGICYVAATNAAERWVARLESQGLPQRDRDRDEPITREDFEAAMKSVVPVSASDPEIVLKNEAFSLAGKSTTSGKGDDEAED